MKRIIGIYKITSPTGRIYIGQSVNILRRKYYYEKQLCVSQPKLFLSLKKYGFKNHTFEILVECLSKNLNDLEKHFVDMFNSTDAKTGLNIREGGGNLGMHSEASKLKISKANKGRVSSRKGAKLSEETKYKLRVANLGKVISNDVKKRISQTLKNRVITTEHRMKISIALKGKVKTKEHIENNRISQIRNIKSDGYVNKNKGRIHSESMRMKLRDAWKKRRLRNEV